MCVCVCACVCVCERERGRERERETEREGEREIMQYTTVCNIYRQHNSTHNDYASPHPVYNKLTIPERFSPINEITLFV